MQLTPTLIRRLRAVQKDYEQFKNPRTLQLKLRYEVEIDLLLKDVEIEKMDSVIQPDLFSQQEG